MTDRGPTENTGDPSAHLPPVSRPVIGERTLLATPAFDLKELTVRAPDGRSLSRGVIRHRGAATVVPVLETPDGPVILTVRCERHAVGVWLDELPAGGIEPGEAPIEAAARELVEETGYESATIEPLGRFYTTPGLTNELMHAFIARDLVEVGQRLDEDEMLTVHPVPVVDLFDRLDRGVLVDGKSMLALLLARRKGALAGIA